MSKPCTCSPRKDTPAATWCSTTDWTTFATRNSSIDPGTPARTVAKLSRTPQLLPGTGWCTLKNKCTECNFETSYKYNLLRHEENIHCLVDVVKTTRKKVKLVPENSPKTSPDSNSVEDDVMKSASQLENRDLMTSGIVSANEKRDSSLKEMLLDNESQKSSPNCDVMSISSQWRSREMMQYIPQSNGKGILEQLLLNERNNSLKESQVKFQDGHQMWFNQHVMSFIQQANQVIVPTANEKARNAIWSIEKILK